MSIPSQPGAVLYPQAFGIRPENVEVPVYSNREPTAQDVQFPVGKEWIFIDNSIWKLLGLSTQNGITTANWVEVAGSGGAFDQVDVIDKGGAVSGSVTPIAGVLRVQARKLPQTPPDSDYVVVKDIPIPNQVDIELEVATPSAAPDVAGTIDDAGIVSPNSAQFTVGPFGLMSLKGGSGSTPAVSTETVDAFTAPATTATVVANASGDIRVRGASVVAGTNPVRSNSHAASEFTVEVQTSQAIAATDATKIGLSNYNSAQFGVDANGFVSLVGGGASPAVVSETVDTFTAPAVTAVVAASATGDIRARGASVAAGTNPVRTNSHAANEFTTEVQISQAVAATDATKIGLANFDSAAFTVDANGFVQLAVAALMGSSYPGLPNNLAFSKAANTTTFTGFDGTALSAANPANFWINHPTSRSQLVHINLVNPWQVVDAGGAGDMNGNSFGTSAGAWATDMPWYIYLVVNDAATAGAIAFSRVPHLTVAPVAGLCATRGSAVATTQGSMYFLDEVILGVPTAPTVANFDGNPCVCVGSIRTQKAAANDWVIQTPDKSDGIGLFHENSSFTYPGNQNTANPVTNNPTHFVETAGFPAYASQNYFYTMSRNGSVEAALIMSNLTANGANATDIVITLPIKNKNFMNKQVGWFGVTGSPLPWLALNLNGGSISGSFKWESASSTFLTNADITGAPDAAGQFNVALTYIADIA